MTKYSEDLTKEIKEYLEAFNFVFRDTFVIYDTTDSNILQEVFGLDDDLYEVFNVKFKVREMRVKDMVHFFIYNTGFKSPIAAVSKNNKLNFIRIGYAHEHNLNGKTPLWYSTPPENDSLIFVDEVSSVIEEIYKSNNL